MEPGKTLFICPFCGHLSKMIWVHGHGQCAVCGITIDECCRGEQSDCTIDNVKSTEEKESDKNKIPIKTLEKKDDEHD